MCGPTETPTGPTQRQLKAQEEQGLTKKVVLEAGPTRIIHVKGYQMRLNDNYGKHDYTTVIFEKGKARTTKQECRAVNFLGKVTLDYQPDNDLPDDIKSYLVTNDAVELVFDADNVKRL